MTSEVRRRLDPVTKGILEAAAGLPHADPHYRAMCVRCAARATLSWADSIPPFLDELASVLALPGAPAESQQEFGGPRYDAACATAETLLSQPAVSRADAGPAESRDNRIQCEDCRQYEVPVSPLPAGVCLRCGHVQAQPTTVPVNASRELLPAMSGHLHIVYADGTLGCGCVWKPVGIPTAFGTDKPANPDPDPSAWDIHGYDPKEPKQ